MDRRPDELSHEGELRELDALSDDALNQLGDRVPAAWLDATTNEDELAPLAETEEGLEVDPGRFRELLAGLDSEAEERVAARVVDDFLGGAAESGVVASGGGGSDVLPAFLLDERPHADVIPIQSAASAEPQRSSGERPWWGVALPLAAAAVVLLVLIDGPGLSAVFDDEGRVRPAEISPNATASAESGASRAKWSAAEVPVPGTVPGGASAAETPEAEEATISVPGGRPRGKPGGVAGGVVGGVVGGVLGGSLGGVPGGSPGGVPGGAAGGVPGAVGSAQTPVSSKQSDAPQRPKVMPIDAVMGHSLYAPDPAPKALASTKAGMFDRRPCTSRIRFCVDPRGQSVNVRSTGSCHDPKVDQICRETVRKWRFKPFVVAGKASPVCTEVSFDLRFDKRR